MSDLFVPNAVKTFKALKGDDRKKKIRAWAALPGVLSADGGEK